MTTDPTRFDLDDRQRAMLAEMGVRVWWPQSPVPAPDVPDVVVAQAEAVTAPVAQPQVTSAPRPVVTERAAVPVVPSLSVAPAPAAVAARPLPTGVDSMDWATLQTTAAACEACTLCSPRKASVWGVGASRADWLVIGDPQAEAEGQAGEPFVGQASQLLDNMLKAVGLNRQAQDEGAVFITSSLKCHLPGSRNPTPEEQATCAPYLARQVTLVQPKVILVMGRFAVQSVLQSTEPLGKLRGQLHRYQGVPVVVTYHPEALLRNPADKAKAWADLVLALQAVRG